MCGRFNLTDSPQLQALLKDLNIDIGPLPVRYNIAPTEPVLTLFQHTESDSLEYRAREMRWWLTPRWASEPSQKFAMFNARAETVASSKAFAAPFKRQRAIIPASSFIEWQTREGNKQAYLMSFGDELCLMAAIWERWQRDDDVIYSCAMLTTASAPDFGEIHKRQPLMLDRAAALAWMQIDQSPEVLQQLLHAELPGPMSVTPITSALNNARNKIAPEPAGSARMIKEEGNRL